MSNLFVNGTQIPSGYTLTIYKYEPFSFLFTPASGYLQLMSSSTLVTSMVRTESDAAIVFQSPGYLPWDPQTRGYTGATSTTEQIVIGWGPFFIVSGSGSSLSIQQTYVVNVVIKAGRFVSPALDIPSYSLYVNESISRTYGSDIVFTAPGGLTVTAPFTTPALPPGLSFVSTGAIPSLNWLLTGTPLTGSPSTSYTVYARGSSNMSAIISKTFTISIGAERISLAISPSSNVALSVRNEIPPVQITAWYPNIFPGNLRYTWSFLPDGLQFTDISLNPVASPFFPTDSNSTIYLLGTPTSAAAQVFKNAGTSNIVANLVATRLTTPNITATQPIDYTIGTFILFDPVTIPTLYRDAPITPGSIVFRANTYFPSGSNMVIMNAPNGLPPGLSLDYTFGNNYAYLVGTPTAEVSATYQIQATNFSAVSETLDVPITVEGDVVSILGPLDTCYNFVISRPLNSNLAGYYPAPISYTAVSSEGGAPVISVTGFQNTGINVGIVGSSLSLSGIPDTITGLTTAVITGSNPVTGATVTKNFDFAVVTDDVSITNPTSEMTFFQNQEITSVQFSATTLSERPIVNWSSANLPSGLSLSSTGRLTGTPTASNVGSTFNVTASTGYISETNAVSYKTVRDDVLLAQVQDPAYISAQSNTVEMRVVTYSGAQGSMSFNSISPLQQDSISLSVSGNFLTFDLSATVTLPEYRFILLGEAGTFVDQNTFKLTFDSPDTQRRFVLDTVQTAAPVVGDPFFKYRTDLYTNEDSGFVFSGVNPVPAANSFSNWTRVLSTESTPFGRGQFAQSANVCMLTSGKNIYRSTTNGSTWSLVPASDVSSFSNIVGGYVNVPPIVTTPGPALFPIATDGNSNWLILGNGYDTASSYAQRTVVRTSSNGGLTWIDSILTTPILPGNNTAQPLYPASRLYYNQGRYFLANGSGYSSYRADVSTLGIWLDAPSAIPPDVVAFGFSNDTLLGGSGTTLYKSVNNGESWTTIPWYGTTIVDIQYVGSNLWYISDSNGLYSSSNANDFTFVADAAAGLFGYDGASHYGFLYSNSILRSVVTPFDSNILTTIGSTDLSMTAVSQVATRIIRSGSTAAQLSPATNTSSFIEPTVLDYTFLQFVGANIPIRLAPTSEFIYYYATDLPQGMRLVLDPSGISADISGIPTLYNAGGQRTLIFAREPIASNITSLSIGTRVVSPFVLKPQSSAAGYTAFLRQYVEVNAAQGARDSVALPVEENPIGKFTSPGAPDVITQRVDPKCFSTSNCQ